MRKHWERHSIMWSAILSAVLLFLSAMLSPIAVNLGSLQKYSGVIVFLIFAILSAGQFQAARSTGHGKGVRFTYRLIGVLLIIPAIIFAIGFFIV